MTSDQIAHHLLAEVASSIGDARFHCDPGTIGTIYLLPQNVAKPGGMPIYAGVCTLPLMHLNAEKGTSIICSYFSDHHHRAYEISLNDPDWLDKITGKLRQRITYITRAIDEMHDLMVSIIENDELKPYGDVSAYKLVLESTASFTNAVSIGCHIEPINQSEYLTWGIPLTYAYAILAGANGNYRIDTDAAYSINPRVGKALLGDKIIAIDEAIKEIARYTKQLVSKDLAVVNNSLPGQ